MDETNDKTVAASQAADELANDAAVEAPETIAYTDSQPAGMADESAVAQPAKQITLPGSDGESFSDGASVGLLVRERSALRVLLGCAIAYLACTVAFSALLLGVWAIPKQAIRPQVEESLGMLLDEGDYPSSRVTFQMRGDTIDAYTTALTLNIAEHGTGNIVKDAVSCSFYLGKGPYTQVLQESLDKPANQSYTRYWHGYLVVLMPLLTVFSIAQIRCFFLVAMGLLSCVACVTVGRRAPMPVVLCLALGLLSANLWVAAYSTSLAFCFFVALAAVAWLASRVDESYALGHDVNLVLFFFVVGALTVYFDFLNTPIVSLGLPLATYLALRRDAVLDASVGRVAGLVAVCCVAWGAGYGLLWATKWLIGALVLGGGELTEIADIASWRASADSVLARFGGIKANVWTMLEPWQRYLALAYLALVALLVVVRRRKGFASMAVALLMVALLPVLWYLALSNHSTIHAFFTYRALCVSVYALALTGYLLVRWPSGRAAR